MTSVQERKIRQTGCEARFDNLTRQLYATDASIYQIEPIGVVFPKSAEQASLVIRAAADAGLSVTPRGAGTSLVGNAIGEGLIVEFSRYNRQITELDIEKRSVRVGAGLVLDQLNDFLKPHGFCFGPDVATSSRATLGGMIANNSSGARCPIYGTTADHVISLEIVMADGRVEKIGPTHKSLRSERATIENLIRAASAEMTDRWPRGLIKRWPGYGVERFLRAPNDLTNILAGSEGTLAAIFSAQLKMRSSAESGSANYCSRPRLRYSAAWPSSERARNSRPKICGPPLIPSGACLVGSMSRISWTSSSANSVLESSSSASFNRLPVG